MEHRHISKFLKIQLDHSADQIRTNYLAVRQDRRSEPFVVLLDVFALEAYIFKLSCLLPHKSGRRQQGQTKKPARSAVFWRGARDAPRRGNGPRRSRGRAGAGFV